MIKQKYNYSFFYDNYKYRHYRMFKNYYKRLEQQYRYFIILKKDINRIGTSEVYRSNLSIDELLQVLKGMTFQVAEIQDTQSSFPDPVEYEYIKINDFEQIVKIYRNEQSQTRRFYNGDLIYMYYADYKSPLVSARMDNKSIQICYNGYEIRKYFDDKDIIVRKTVPLSTPISIKYTSEHRDLVEKVIKRILRDNREGFYYELVNSVKGEFGIH